LHLLFTEIIDFSSRNGCVGGEEKLADKKVENRIMRSGQVVKSSNEEHVNQQVLGCIIANDSLG
jgi:hypothetical protein